MCQRTQSAAVMELAVTAEFRGFIPLIIKWCRHALFAEKQRAGVLNTKPSILVNCAIAVELWAGCVRYVTKLPTLYVLSIPRVPVISCYEQVAPKLISSTCFLLTFSVER